MEELCSLAKYGPIKDYLVKAYQKRRPEGQKSKRRPEDQKSKRSTEARARSLYQVLKDTALHFSGVNLKTPWIENCGRFVSNHSGFVPLLARLRVVRKWGPRSKGTKLDFSGIGGTSEPRALLPYRSSAAHLRALLKKADALQSVPVPVNGRQWQSTLQQMSMKNKYLTLWNLRSHWFPVLASGTSAGHFDVEGVSLRGFSCMFPDVGHWVLRLAPRAPYTVKGLFAHVHYRANPVLFTCFACLFADAGVVKYAPEQILKSIPALKKGLGQYRSKHGIWPHPAILLREVLGDPERTDAAH